MKKSTSVRWNTDVKHQIKNWLTAKETSKFYLSPILGIDPNLEGLKQIRPWNNSYKINSKGTGQKQSKNNQIWGYPKVENCKKVLKPNLNKEPEVQKSTK